MRRQRPIESSSPPSSPSPVPDKLWKNERTAMADERQFQILVRELQKCGQRIMHSSWGRGWTVGVGGGSNQSIGSEQKEKPGNNLSGSMVNGKARLDERERRDETATSLHLIPNRKRLAYSNHHDLDSGPKKRQCRGNAKEVGVLARKRKGHLGDEADDLTYVQKKRVRR
ncbi:predicted protein [Plenodomus lingam JN3]|uniref:Predicted protein n=1 Tax=Leptosphaeria maculans (strain JN3 / isolate v23.1.3 / race Av1-4-5-6-7-8) TaxID=985895 RepID=E4ZT81_LEPMJ|nr:predicted protein [Plenodomus lingam JN3]CBX90023.1 predicted protein [Plenodomus lingam JN3]